MFKVLITDPLSDQGIEKLRQSEDIQVIKKTKLLGKVLITLGLGEISFSLDLI